MAFNKWCLLFCSAIIFFSACVEGDDEIVPQRSYVTFVNAHPSSAAGVQFRIGEAWSRTGTLAFGRGSDYNQIYSGDWTLGAHVADASQKVLAEADLQAAPDWYYTCFLTGTASEGTMLLVADDLSAPSNRDTAKVRFVNLNQQAGSVYVETERNVRVFENQQYLEATEFTEMDTLNHTLRVFATDDSSTPLARLRFRAERGRIYTLYLTPREARTDSIKLLALEHLR